MKDFLKELFLSKRTFIICEALALLFWVMWGISCITEGFLYELAVDAVLYIALTGGLLISYERGETNVQKLLLGSLFLILCNSNIEILLTYIKNQEDTFSIVVESIILVLSVIVFVCHIVLQSDHVGVNKAIIFNQCCGLLVVAIVLLDIRQTFFVEKPSLLDMTFIPAWALTYLVIICIETRVQEYKQIRTEAIENGIWNDETRRQTKSIFKL